MDMLTKEEIYILAKKKAGGGGDITVEELNVTENGQYTAPSGKAYSPVNVAVPLPENAYYLKESLEANPLSISDGEGLHCESAKVTMLPIQDLHGYDAPWPAGGGKNKLDEQAIKDNLVDMTLHFIPITLPFNTAATFSDDYGQWNGKGLYLAVTTASDVSEWEEADKVFIIDSSAYNRNSFTFTTFGQQMYLRFYGNNDFYQYATKMQLEAGSTATSYAPYENICSISGRTEVSVTRTGKNVFDVEKFLTDNRIVYTKTDGWYEFNVSGALYFNHFKLPELAYYSGFVTVDTSQTVATNFVITTYKNGTAVTNGLSFKNREIDEISFNWSQTSKVRIKSQIEYGESYTTYEPYQGETHTATFSDTVYGGEYEFVEAPLKNTLKVVDLGDYDYAYDSYRDCFLGALLPESGANAYDQKWQNVFCDIYTQYPTNAMSTAPNNSISVGVIGTGAYRRFIIKDSRFTSETDPADVKTAMTGVKATYGLLTPTETTLTPQSISLNKGDNVITTDGGTVQIEYWAKNNITPTRQLTKSIPSEEIEEKEIEEKEPEVIEETKK